MSSDETEASWDPAAPPPRLAYDGAGGPLFRLVFVNMLLNVATVGFWRFWGKTRVRRYLWSRLTFGDDRLEYTGTGRELFLGFLIVLGVLIPLALLANLIDLLYAENPMVLAARNAGYAILGLFLVEVAIYRARGYRLSRTQWRGIRAAQSGSSPAYGLLGMGYILLTVLTLGLALPLQNVRLMTYKMENTWFGDRPLRFDGRAGPLAPKWFVCWLLLPFTLGLSYLWYKAAEVRYFAGCTQYEGLRFGSALAGGRLVGIHVAYGLTLLVLFLAAAAVPMAFVVPVQAQQAEGIAAAATGVLPVVGVLFALVVVRPLYYVMVVHALLGAFSESLSIAGGADFEAIRQSQRERPRRGEGLAEALDIGGI